MSTPTNLIPFPSVQLATVPVPLHQDTDDDLLEEPRSRVHHSPRPALRDPLESPAFLARFGAAQRGTRPSTLTERTAA